MAMLGAGPVRTAAVWGIRAPGRSAVAVVALVMAACSPSLDWRQVTLDGSVQALFPCRVETRTRNGVPLAGESWAMTQTACEERGMTFAVTVVPVPAGRDRVALGSALASAAAANVSGVVRPVGGEPVAGGGVSQPVRSLPGRLVVDGRRSDGQTVRVELLLVDRPGFLFQAAVVGRAPHDTTVQLFFDEFAQAVRRADPAGASR